MKKFIPQSPDKYLVKESNMSLAKFGHLNAIVESLTESENTLDTVEQDLSALTLVVNSIGANVYADNAAALLGGLVAGELYSTVTGEVRIVV